jgi:hypothetical protein
VGARLNATAFLSRRSDAQIFAQNTASPAPLPIAIVRNLGDAKYGDETVNLNFRLIPVVCDDTDEQCVPSVVVAGPNVRYNLHLDERRTYGLTTRVRLCDRSQGIAARRVIAYDSRNRHA